MANKIVANKKVGTAINTIQGEATYSHTEREDLEGNWDDHWETRNGEFVIHDNSHHHVYIITNEDVTNSVLEAHNAMERAVSHLEA